MFVKPLALLLFNVFACLRVLWCCRFSHSNHGCKGWKRAKKVKLCSLPLCSSAQRGDRAHCAQTQGLWSSTCLVSPRFTRFPSRHRFSLHRGIPEAVTSDRARLPRSIAYMLALKRNACDRAHSCDIAAHQFSINRTFVLFSRELALESDSREK
jgi:hypothetical protein